MRSLDLAKLAVDTAGRERIDTSSVSARRHNGLPLTIGIIRGMRSADEDEAARNQDRSDRAVMVELLAERYAAIEESCGGDVEFVESLGVRVPSLFEDC